MSDARRIMELRDSLAEGPSGERKARGEGKKKTQEEGGNGGSLKQEFP